MSLLGTVAKSVCIAVIVVFLYYVDNSTVARYENAKFYYKRTMIVSVAVFALLSIIDAQSLGNSSSTKSTRGGFGASSVNAIQTGNAPF